MPTDMLLSLRFRPAQRSPSCFEVAAVLEDLEALYAAVPKAAATDEPVSRHVLAEHRARIDAALGLSDFALAEVEYRVRALTYLEALGADRRTTDLLRAAVQGVAESEARRALGEGNPTPIAGSSTGAMPQLKAHRISMASPLELIVGLPFEYWVGPSFLLFLAALERRFNMIGRIRTEKVDLAARRAERRADEREAQVREEAAKRRLSILQERGPEEESPLLEGLEPAQRQFQLDAGELLLEGDQKARQD